MSVGDREARETAALEAARDSNSYLTADDAERTIVEEARKAGAAKKSPNIPFCRFVTLNVTQFE
jgi:hypothetical protein